jgi:hypothetical protein
LTNVLEILLIAVQITVIVSTRVAKIATVVKNVPAIIIAVIVDLVYAVINAKNAKMELKLILVKI